MSDAGMHTVQTSSDDDFLPEFPGEDAYKHAGTQWKEDAEALLGKRGLLAVAYGDPPPSCAALIDYPLGGLAPLDPTDPYYETRMIKRMQLEEHNAKNAALRLQATLGAWTKVAAACKLCCSKTAPLLSRMIFDTCDLRSRGI